MTQATIAEVMEAYASDAIAHAQQYGFSLDYSEASLVHVDAVLWELTGDGIIEPKTAEDEEKAWLIAKMYGGYLGQVVIADMGGSWELRDLPDGNARIVLCSKGIEMFPLEKVFKRLTQDQYSGISGYCRALRVITERGE